MNLREPVASFTDAWIETLLNSKGVFSGNVASFTDAWIETTFAEQKINSLPSHLLQMRGLKLTIGFARPTKTSRIFYRCVD